jgi:hypothetical protein
MVVGVYIVVLDVNLAYISKQTAGASHLKPMMYHSFIMIGAPWNHRTSIFWMARRKQKRKRKHTWAAWLVVRYPRRSPTAVWARFRVV